MNSGPFSCLADENAAVGCKPNQLTLSLAVSSKTVLQFLQPKHN